VGQLDFIATNDPAVGIYVDGIYLGRTVGAMLDSSDIARVEVLRGPARDAVRPQHAGWGGEHHHRAAEHQRLRGAGARHLRQPRPHRRGRQHQRAARRPGRRARGGIHPQPGRVRLPRRRRVLRQDQALGRAWAAADRTDRCAVRDAVRGLFARQVQPGAERAAGHRPPALLPGGRRRRRSRTRTTSTASSRPTRRKAATAPMVSPARWRWTSARRR
jgi:hypothetical protein